MQAVALGAEFCVSGHLEGAVHVWDLETGTSVQVRSPAASHALRYRVGRTWQQLRQCKQFNSRGML